MLEDSDRLLETIEQVLRTGRSRRDPCADTRRRWTLAHCGRMRRARACAPPPDSRRCSNTARAPHHRLGDPDEVRAAVSNLIDNAVKYSGKTCTSASRPAVSKAKICVGASARPGVGIPKTELKRIFKRFYRGAGAIRNADKGHWPGTIYCSFRCQTARRPCMGGKRGTGTWQHVCAAASDCKMNRILVVEDEQHLADGLRFNLEAEGYEVEVVETGEEALRRSRRRCRHSTWWSGRDAAR